MSEQIPYIERNRKNFWIVLGIYISIFINSYIFFKEPVEFYIGYLVYIFLLPGFIIRFGVNRELFFIFFVLLLSGIGSVLLGSNTSSQFYKVFIGLFLSYFFYYYVILELESNVEQLFKWYLYGCYLASILGFFQLASYQIGFKQGYKFFHIFNKWGFAPGGAFGIRINSIFPEPTHLGTALSAAFFVAVYNLISNKPFYLTRFQCIVIISIYLLSFSGLGQLGIFLTIFFLAINFGLIRYIIVLIPLSILLFNFLYKNVLEFRERFEGLVSMFSGEKFILGKTHGSSFILYNNYTVALKNFKSNFLFGGGLGSHFVAFQKYSLARDFKVEGINSNGADANSMLLRLISETGIFGISIFLFIVIKCYVGRNTAYLTYHWLISNGILIMILLNLFRQGHYFLLGFPFFVLLYYFNWISYKIYVAENKLL